MRAPQVLLAVVAQFQMRWLSLRAATRLHAQMLNSLLYAPLSFFHTHPSGRIINRLTKDTNDIDRNLATFASSWFNGILQLLSTAAVVGAVTPFVLPCLVPVLLAFGLLYLYFQASVREVKRLDALARSPIFTAVGNTLTVRPSPHLRRDCHTFTTSRGIACEAALRFRQDKREMTECACRASRQSEASGARRCTWSAWRASSTAPRSCSSSTSPPTAGSPFAWRASGRSCRSRRPRSQLSSAAPPRGRASRCRTLCS